MCPGTIGAFPGYDEVDAVSNEVVTPVEMQADLTDQLPGVVPYRSAGTADEVELVVGMSDLPSCRLIDAETGTTHQIELFEDGEGTVDRGAIDGGVGVVHPVSDFIGREVPVCGAQHRPDEPARAGEAIAMFAEDMTDVGGGRHATRVSVDHEECDTSVIAMHSQ